VKSAYIVRTAQQWFLRANNVARKQLIHRHTWTNQDIQSVTTTVKYEDIEIKFLHTFPWHCCCDSSEVHQRWAAILHVLHRRACLEFPAERGKDESVRTDETQPHTRWNKASQQAADLHPNQPQWPSGPMSKSSRCSGGERNKVLSSYRAAADSFIINGSFFKTIWRDWKPAGDIWTLINLAICHMAFSSFKYFSNKSLWDLRCRPFICDADCWMCLTIKRWSHFYPRNIR